MAVTQRTLKETYQFITVFLKLDGTSATGSLLLDASSLSHYDLATPNSSDIMLTLAGASFNLSGPGNSTAATGGEVILLNNHQTTDTEIIRLTGNGAVSFSPALTREDHATLSNTNFNGDINYSVTSNTTGHAIITFAKKTGYHMSFAKWKKPTQHNPYP